jgi:hypothetical protein
MMGRRSKQDGYDAYQHVKKLGTTEVDGILMGEVYVFPKIDGTNAHVWYDDGQHHFGSRNRELSIGSDNAGFMAWASECDELLAMSAAVEGAHVYGEWLVPHTLKTYRKDAWRKFYVFDITETDETGVTKHYNYARLKELCDEYGVDYIPPIRRIRNPQYENILSTLEENTYLLEEGQGVGEGVVLKNYDFINRYGRQTWAKVVTSDFKAKHCKEMGAPKSTGTRYVEEEIVEKFLTDDIIDKVYAKIVTSEGGWESKFIQRFLHTVWYDFVNECMWDAVKKFKNPTINFKQMMQFCVMRIKRHKPELF